MLESTAVCCWMPVTGSVVYGRPRFDVFSEGGMNEGPPRANGSFPRVDYKEGFIRNLIATVSGFEFSGLGLTNCGSNGSASCCNDCCCGRCVKENWLLPRAIDGRANWNPWLPLGWTVNGLGDIWKKSCWREAGVCDCCYRFEWDKKKKTVISVCGAAISPDCVPLKWQ